MRPPRLAPTALVAAALALAACEHSHGGTPTGATCPTDSTLTWDNFGSAFMDTYCNACHRTGLKGAERQGAPSDHNFETVELVRMWLDHLDETVAAGPDAINTAMPIGDGPTPTDEERRQLGEWLACGAP